MANVDPEFFRRNRDLKVIHDCPPCLNDKNQNFCELGKFPVEGQGAIGFKFVLDDDAKEVQFRFDPSPTAREDGKEPYPDPVLHTVSNERWVMTDLITNEKLGEVVYNNCDGLPLLNPGRNQTLWMSFDKENLILRGGSGYMLTALQRVTANFTDPKDIYEDQKYSMDPSSIKGDGCKNVELIKSKYPIYRDLPPIVKDHQEITLEDLDAGTAIPIKELSPECQRLYANVAGASIVINPPDFPDFAQAIYYSINYGFCKSKLIEKAKSEFEGSDKDYDANQSYLRITLGSNLGDSPGIPYVMEIWPAGSYSPIHDHSQANAIIEVIHGSLTTRWFEGLDRTQQQLEMSREKSAIPYNQAVVSNGDVTWLGDRQFQTHQLFNHNINGTACITIQCYMYNDRDVNHYENFDYVGGNNGDDIIGFIPNSDWDYENFKHLTEEEFMKYKQEAVPKPNFKPRSSNRADAQKCEK